MQPDFNSHNRTEGHFIWPRAKGCDHEIVRALETHLKAVPWTFEIGFYMVTGLQVQCKDICDRALNEMLFITILSCGPLYMISCNKSSIVRF
jgi:hypothetical protein